MNNKIDKAIELCNKKQFNKAETILRDIVNENHNNSEAWRMLAQIDWFENNEIEKAYNELIEALKIDSKNLWALVLMGNMQSKVYNDIKTASEYYEKVLEYHPDNAIAINNIGATLLEKGNYNEALVYFDKAISIDPRYLNCHYGKACALNRLGKEQEAFEICIKGALKTEERPENPETRTEMLRMMLSLANSICEKTDYIKEFERLCQKYELDNDIVIKISKDPQLNVYARMKYALYHGVDYHEIIYNPNRPMTPHLLFHELMHLIIQSNNTKAGKGKVFVCTEKNKEAFNKRYGKFIKNIHNKLSNDNATIFVKQLQDGIALQLMNCPIDLFVEDMLYNEYPAIRPAQLLSLFKMEQENIKSANDTRMGKIFPADLFRANKVMNMVTSMHFAKLYGINLLNEYHPSKIEYEQAKDLYDEYLAFIDTFKTGDEYELAEYFAASFDMEDLITIDDEKMLIQSRSKYEEANAYGEDDELADMKKKLAEESLTISKNAPSRDDVEDLNADFAINHPDGGNEAETMMMSMYMVGAMEYLDTVSRSEVEVIAFEIAKVGITGINPDKHYKLDSVKGKDFSGYMLLAWYYVSWARSHPELLPKLNLPFSKAYELAITLYKSRNNK